MNIATVETRGLYSQTVVFWEQAGSFVRTGSETPGNLNDYVYRHTGHSFVVFEGNTVTGTTFCGHDGKRGYIHHIAADQRSSRRIHKSILYTLLKHALDTLVAEDISTCHVFAHRFRIDESGNVWKTIIDSIRKEHTYRDLTLYFHDIELPFDN